jgi:hypothetical protein
MFTNSTHLKKIKRIPFENNVDTISYSFEKNILAIGFQNGEIKILDLLTFETLASTRSHGSYLWCSTLSKFGKYLYTGDNFGRIVKTDIDKILNNPIENPIVCYFKLLNYSDVRCLLTYKNSFVSVGSNYLITITDIETNEKLKTIKIPNKPCSMKLIDDEIFMTTDEGTLDVLNLLSFEIKILEKGISSKAVWSFIQLKNGIQLFGDDIGNLIWKKNGNWERLMICDDRISEMMLYEQFLIIISFSGTLLFVDYSQTNDFRVIFEYKENCKFTHILNCNNKYFFSCGVDSKSLFIWCLDPVSKIIQILKNQKTCDVNFHFS